MTAAKNKLLSSRTLLLTTTVLVAAVLAIIIFFVGSKFLKKDDGFSSPATTLSANVFATSIEQKVDAPRGSAKETTATMLPSSKTTDSAKPLEGTASATNESMPFKPATQKPDNGKPYMHLTFDDGPFDLTPYVLNMLSKHNIQATFFMQGSRIDERPELAKQVLNAGHAIANHSYKHDGWKSIGVGAAKADVIKTQGVIRSAVGVIPSCARAPFGDDSPEINAMLNDLGIAHWEWDLDPKEWESGRDDRLKNLLDNPSGVPKLTDTDGYILLLHDSHPSLKSAIDTLDTWIAVNKDNYQFTAIPGCLDYQ